MNETTTFGHFGAHIFNGGVYGKITGRCEDEFWNYELNLSLSNFCGFLNTNVNIQDEKMVDELINGLLLLKEHMRTHKFADYI